MYVYIYIYIYVYNYFIYNCFNIVIIINIAFLMHVVKPVKICFMPIKSILIIN